MELFSSIYLSLPNSFLALTPLSHKQQSHLFPKSHLSSSTPQFLPKSLNKSAPNSLITKRSLNFSLITLLLSISLPFTANGVELKSDDDDDELEKYSDFEQGFTLLRPTSYIKVDKAGATALFEQVNKGANNVGVVVTPVRLASLTDFGTPQFVADKLIQAEKRKESTNDAGVIAVAERSGLGGLPVYEFEYFVDSTRGGLKRVFSAAFVSQMKLYLLNITHSDKPESPLDSHTRKMLEQVLHSFDALPLTKNST